jgi:hypothetical protein
MDGTGDHHVKQNKSESERQVSLSFRCESRKKDDIKVEGGLLEKRKGSMEGEEEGNVR